MKTFAETDRLILRELAMDDVDDLFEMDSDPKVHKYLGNNPVKTREESEKIMENILQQYREEGIGRWAIIEKESGEFLGWSGLKHEHKLRPGKSYYDLGYRLKRKYWGKGFASEAARASMVYGFETMNLEWIGACASTNNLASNKIIQKLGFTYKEQFSVDLTICYWYTFMKFHYLNNKNISQ